MGTILEFKIPESKAGPPAPVAVTPDDLIVLPMYTVVNPGGRVIDAAALPPYIDLFTNSSGYCASDEVLDEARLRGIVCLQDFTPLDGDQALSICRVDDEEPPFEAFDDVWATVELVHQGFMVVKLPDFLPELVGQPDGGSVNGKPTHYELMDSGQAPFRFYAVQTYNPPKTEA